jgi:hypothetical protein
MGIKNLDALNAGCSTCFGLKKVRANEKEPWQPCPECSKEEK